MPGLPRRGFPNPDHRFVVDELMDSVRHRVSRVGSLGEAAVRACRAAALCAEVYRMGSPYPGSPIDVAIREDAFTVERLLTAAPSEGVRDLQLLHEVAVETLYPALPTTPARCEVGPEFEASKWRAADADLAVDGMLLEVKTGLGRKQPSGLRVDRLEGIDLYQLLGYLLFDVTDRLQLDAVGFYSGRYGHLFRLSVEEFLRLLAGGPVDLATERAADAELLRPRG